MADTPCPDKPNFIPPPTVTAVTLIDAAYVAQATSRDSVGINMSSVAEPCYRKLWYALRWVSEPEEIDGRKQRIFKSGEIYETRLLDDLRAIGCTVLEVDETTGAQMRVELAGGHLRGKVDGRLTGFYTGTELIRIVEAKSMNERAYKALVKAGGVREGKPEHYAQIQAYLHGTETHHGIYIAACKNDDAIWVEEVDYDPAFGAAMVERVERIVAANTPPARLFDNPSEEMAFKSCGFCSARPQCHEGAWSRVHCRTCLEAEALNGPQWRCSLTGAILSYDEQQIGCAEHRFIPGLVPGEQTDSNPETRTITYRLADGATWIDGGQS